MVKKKDAHAKRQECPRAKSAGAPTHEYPTNTGGGGAAAPRSGAVDPPRRGARRPPGAARPTPQARRAAASRSLEWEVLLATNSLENLVVDDDDGGVETYFLDDADDVLFGQLAAEAEHEPPAKGGRPTVKAAVEGLPTVVVAEADASRGDAQCAVCKDGIEAGEGAKRLPCAHLYHDAYILPWLTIRNTCPLCRHELPTDDPEYEKWKAQRAGGGGNADANGDSDMYDVIRLP